MATALSPTVSVIMAAYSTDQEYFSQAVKSILVQTFNNFEFLIVDDGLSDKNRDYLRALDDKRITVIKNECNIGQSKSVNKALKIAKGEYIARMDSDDVSLPERLAIQAAYLDSNVDAIACGGMARILGTKKVIPRRFPDTVSWKAGMCFACEMVHPTMMFRRKEALDAGICYDENILYAQDYMMWARLSEAGLVGVVPDVVLEYRIHSGQISSKKTATQTECAQKARRVFLEACGFLLDEKDFHLIEEVAVLGLSSERSSYEQLFAKLRSQMLISKDPAFAAAFNRELAFRILKASFREFVKGGNASWLAWRELLSVVFKPRYWSFYIKGLTRR